MLSNQKWTGKDGSSSTKGRKATFSSSLAKDHWGSSSSSSISHGLGLIRKIVRHIEIFRLLLFWLYLATALLSCNELALIPLAIRFWVSLASLYTAEGCDTAKIRLGPSPEPVKIVYEGVERSEAIRSIDCIVEEVEAVSISRNGTGKLSRREILVGQHLPQYGHRFDPK
ncbi:hypothetical protein AUP68_04125 [Ilyonectria robusta]